VLALLVSLGYRGEGGGVAAGASGAGFGLFGMVGVYAWRRGLEDIKRVVIQWTLISLVFGFGSKNIDNASHVGGLVAGIAISWSLRDAQWTRLHVNRVRAWDVGAIISILAVLAAFGFAFVDGGRRLAG
jgi:membrane associated rhomboid family serine protease